MAKNAGPRSPYGLPRYIQYSTLASSGWVLRRVPRAPVVQHDDLVVRAPLHAVPPHQIPLPPVHLLAEPLAHHHADLPERHLPPPLLSLSLALSLSPSLGINKRLSLSLSLALSLARYRQTCIFSLGLNEHLSCSLGINERLAFSDSVSVYKGLSVSQSLLVSRKVSLSLSLYLLVTLEVYCFLSFSGGVSKGLSFHWHL